VFHDLNNLQKTVSTSQAQIVEDGRVDWDSEAWMKLDQLNAINARLFLNQTTISGARPADINPREGKSWVFWKRSRKYQIFSIVKSALLLKPLS
jgi:hypothetical protein